MEGGFVDKLRRKANPILAAGLFCGFLFYWGSRIQGGMTPHAGSKFFLVRWVVELAKSAVERWGHASTGHAIMGLALGLFVYAVVILWKEDMI